MRVVHGKVNLTVPVRAYIDALVHLSARNDALTAARHRAFIAPRLLGGLAALAMFPLYLVVRGVPSSLEIVAFAWLMAPLGIGYFLSRTGRYELAYMLSSFALTALITVVAAMSGGAASFVAAWLVVVPVEAALSASRRVVAVAAALALAALALLLTIAPDAMSFGALSREGLAVLAAMGVGSAALYSALLALGAESMSRTGSQLLSDEETRYRLLAMNMTDVITRHGRNGAVLFASPAAERLLGVPVRELAGHGLFDRVHVGDRPAYLRALSESARDGIERSVEFRVRPAVGATEARTSPQFVWVEMRCRAVEAGGQSGACEVVAVTRDISERKAHADAVDEARSEADVANAARSRFLATMSHELRTPLNAVIGFSEMLMNEVAMRIDIEKRQDYARLIHESGHHLLSVVNLVLDMSKIESGNFVITPEPFAPGAVVRSCADLLALKAQEACLDLVMRLPADLPEMVADKRALKQMLLNLLSNAIKFTDRGGRITVAAAASGHEIVISVEDTGVGISEADLPRLGNPFFQARGSYDRPFDGTGLGLSIVRGLVELHGGRMDIASRLGEGTRVTLHLPVDCEARKSVAHVATLPMAEPRAEHDGSDGTDFQANIQVKKRA